MLAVNLQTQADADGGFFVYRKRIFDERGDCTNRENLNMATRMALLDACAAQVSLALDLIMAMRIAEASSQQDLLIGLRNRRGLESKLPQRMNSVEKTANRLLLGFMLFHSDVLHFLNHLTLTHGAHWVIRINELLTRPAVARAALPDFRICVDMLCHRLFSTEVTHTNHSS
jgi:GGDEF domain-containing protein